MPCQLQPWEIEIENSLRRQREGLPTTAFGLETEVRRLRQDMKKLKKEADKRTAMLCELCALVESHNRWLPHEVYVAPVPGRIEEWYENHKKVDKKARKKKTATAVAATKKTKK